MTDFVVGEQYSNEGPVCPYCGIIIDVDGGKYYDADRYTEDECPDCGKQFRVNVYVSYSWTTDYPKAKED